MKEKVYSIKGFDCPGCASNAERHLAEQDTIVSARIDFTNSRLYLTYAEEELDIPELLRLIAEVEEDEVTINEDIDEVKSNLQATCTKLHYPALSCTKLH